MIQLFGRTQNKAVPAEKGFSLLELALKYEIDWGFSCTQGNCARCRCLVESGMDNLSEPSEAELDRLEPEEIKEGFRLGCQAILVKDGAVNARNKTYF